MAPKPEQPDLLPDDSGPSETFVRFDEALAFYARLKSEGKRCISETLDRKRHGYECVVVRDAQLFRVPPVLFARPKT